MWNQYWIPFLIPTLIARSNGDGNRTDSDTVFVRSGGHADVEFPRHTTKTTTKPPTKATTTTTVATTTTTVKIKETTAHFYDEATESVVFVPNKEPPDTRDENDFNGRGLRINDIMMLKTVNDAMYKDFHVEKKEDKPKEDIVFISGKNDDFDNTEPEVKTRRKNDNNNYNYKGEIEEEDELVVTVQPKLNCKNLDCDNTIQSVCGAKLINNEMRYRLFLNDCYFRKVNCGFKYELNRYMQVDTDKCKKIGVHVEKRFSYKTNPHRYKPDPNLLINGRRSPSARRSRTMNVDGKLCSHPCPITCPEDYDPQCAISETGQRRVFVNHCKLDLNSCFYHVGWHKRPLSECVGGKKADMRQNRGFIGWMQRVGIVDRKGRLVLE